MSFIKNKLRQIFFERKISNYFSSDFSKRILIAYITEPFLKKDNHIHTNFAESKVIAKIFNDLGYIVDIVKYNYKGRIDYEKYDVIFGFGPVLSNSFKQPSKKNILRINYATGTHPHVSNQRCLKRAKDVFAKKGEYFLASVRLIDEDYLLQTTLVDGIIVIGNDLIADSYRQFFSGSICKIPVSHYSLCDSREIIANKNFAEAKKHFLFFTSSGMIHRGLDLLLENFSQQTDLHLHICCPLNLEPKFKQAYAKELACPNIHYYGFINIKSETFKKLISQCAFAVLPSCSESQNSAMINLMGNGGLIPILTKEVGNDIENIGFLINDFSNQAVDRAVKIAAGKADDELKELSQRAADFAKTEHSIDYFTVKFKEAISKIIK